MSSGPSYLQVNYRMSAGDQQALKLSAGEAVSNLRSQPDGLPPDLDVRPWSPSEIQVSCPPNPPLPDSVPR
jgi:DNA-binding transcriptional LysR family regulator